MKKILAFGASSSRNSINKQLAYFVAARIKDAEVTRLDLNDFEMPIFSVDRERENGHPEEAKRFKEHIRQSDGIVVSMAEHNGSYSAAFKNLMDWTSRLERSLWLDKPMLVLATSPGGRGAKTVLEQAADRFARMDGRVIGTFSLPSFNKNFSSETGVVDEELKAELEKQLKAFEMAVEMPV